MAVSGANLHNVFMLLTLEPQLARNPYLVLHVRRDHLVSDTLRELTMYSDVDLKKPLKVRANAVARLDSPHTLPLTCSRRRALPHAGDLRRGGSGGRRRRHKRVLPAPAEGAHGSGVWDVHPLQGLQLAVVLRQSESF